MGATLLLGAPSTAAHASGYPPIVQPDSVTVTIDSRPVVVDLTANDTDPEGDRLFFCGTNTSTPIPQGVGIRAGNTRTQVFASSSPGPMDTTGATPGIYVVDAVVCDNTSVVSNPLTITVLPSPGDAVEVARKKPGKARVSNGNDVAIRFFWGAVDHRHPDGRIDVPAHSTRTIRIERRSLVTVVVAGSEFAVGIERHLQPPRDGTALPPGVGPRDGMFQTYPTQWVRKLLHL